MKKIFFTAFLVLLLISCNQEKQEKNVIQETGESIDWYTDTLEWTILDAKDIANQENDRKEKLEEEIKSVK